MKNIIQNPSPLNQREMILARLVELVLEWNASDPNNNPHLLKQANQADEIAKGLTNASKRVKFERVAAYLRGADAAKHS